MRKKFLGAVPVAMAALALVASIGTPATAGSFATFPRQGGAEIADL